MKPIQRVAIVGLGLMGGWLAGALAAGDGDGVGVHGGQDGVTRVQ